MADWTALVDITLARLASHSERSAAALIGVSPGTIGRWRKLRSAHEPIPEPRGDARRALLRTLDSIEGRDIPEESPESAAGAWRVGETPADYRIAERPDASIAALARTMLVGMEREGEAYPAGAGCLAGA